MEADLGRYTDAALLVLVSLADAPKHALAVQADVKMLSGQDLGPGTLYAVIGRLESRQMIARVPGTDPRVKYRITDHGALTLRAQLDAMHRVAQAGLGRLASARSRTSA
jgi:DNA-binding PadR family transcriptional regulator